MWSIPSRASASFARRCDGRPSGADRRARRSRSRCVVPPRSAVMADEPIDTAEIDQVIRNVGDLPVCDMAQPAIREIKRLRAREATLIAERDELREALREAREDWLH